MTRRMRMVSSALALLLCAAVLATAAQAAIPASARSYSGFDKDGYPGDARLPALHRTFAFTGFWLNNPPGMTTNPWAGKRTVVRAAGFGFLILFNGRLDQELKQRDAAALGREDGAAAIAAAHREGFPAGAILFLDQEEGGALLPEQAAYLGAWIATVGASHLPRRHLRLWDSRSRRSRPHLHRAGRGSALSRRAALGLGRPLSALTRLRGARRASQLHPQRILPRSRLAVCAISAARGGHRRVPPHLCCRWPLLCARDAAL